MRATFILAFAFLTASPFGFAAAETKPVNAVTFIRAESDNYMRNIVAQNGGLGVLVHQREVVPLDKQTIIRMNRDTLYSSAVVDLAAGPVTVTMPEVDEGRYVALQVVNQDHLTPMVLHDGSAVLTQESVGTRYAALLVRVFVNPSSPEDITKAHAVQDAIKLEQTSPGSLEMPEWDKTSLDAARKALLDLGALGSEGFGVQMGKMGEVDPIAHLVATAVGWGLNPPSEAIYLNPALTTNDATTVHRLTMKDIPVDAFWSISVYNKAGFFEPNALNRNSVNGVTGTKDADGSITVQFGGCSSDDQANCIPITEGWNYIVRLYQPRANVLDGSWTLPTAAPLQ
ncbi:Protein of unknown function [Gemmobacter aquatilis]|uniref:DUF1254 domain-containing protein n=1 Tax=Gemmobacter aquatilis TaxID=933059 RepID=A0A1H7YIM3_9RHOB|nr:DUF1254 domain-containing protein [Gemmobacter aquatilis]SEM44999.1 Protein of unknown function [Gemmobacter aquatilis]